MNSQIWLFGIILMIVAIVALVIMWPIGLGHNAILMFFVIIIGAILGLKVISDRSKQRLNRFG